MDLKKLIQENLSDESLLKGAKGLSEKFKNTAKNVGSGLLNSIDLFFDALSYAMVKQASKNKKVNNNFVAKPVTNNTNYKNLKPQEDLSQAFYTKISEGQNQKMKKGDSIADILAKMFNFMKKIHKEEIRQMEVSRNLNKKYKYTPDEKEKPKGFFSKVKKEDDEDMPWWQKLLAGLATALGILGSIYSALKGLLAPFSEFFMRLKLPKLDFMNEILEKLKGPKGEPGQRGEKGERGERGEPGQKGEKVEPTEKVEPSNKREGVRGSASREDIPKTGSRNAEMYESMSKEDIAKLEALDIQFNPSTNQFSKRISAGGKPGNRISPEDISRITGKAIPSSAIPQSLKTSKIGEYLKESMDKLAKTKATLGGKAASFVSKTAVRSVAFIGLIMGIYAMAVEIVNLIFEYNDPKSNMTREQLEKEILAIIVATMVEFGVSSVVFMAVDAIVSVMTATFIGPFAILAGTAAGLIASYEVEVHFGGDINSAARKLTKDIIENFVTFNKLMELKQNHKEIKTVDDYNNYMKELSGVTGIPFKPISRNDAGAIALEHQRKMELVKKINSSKTSEEEKQKYKEELKQLNDPNSLLNSSESTTTSLLPTNTGTFADKLNQTAMDTATSKITQPIVINKPTVTNSTGGSSGGSGLVVASSATVRDSSLNRYGNTRIV